MVAGLQLGALRFQIFGRNGSRRFLRSSSADFSCRILPFPGRVWSVEPESLQVAVGCLYFRDLRQEQTGITVAKFLRKADCGKGEAKGH